MYKHNIVNDCTGFPAIFSHPGIWMPDTNPDLSIFWIVSLTLIIAEIRILFKFGQLAPLQVHELFSLGLMLNNVYLLLID